MIAPDNIFGLLAALLCLIATAAALENTWFGRRLSGAGIVILGSQAAAQFEIIPRAAPLYDTIWTYLLPLAVALFLLKADLVRVFAEGGRVLIAFLVGMVGTAAGALFAALVLDVGMDEAKIAGVFAATFTGGSMNFVAVSEAVGFDDPARFPAALALDNILGTGFIVFINIIAGWTLLHRVFHWRVESLAEADGESAMEAAVPLTLANLLASLASAAVVVAVSMWAADFFSLSQYSLLFITVLMTAAATLGRQFARRLRGEDLVAMIFMYLFFAIIGAGANLVGMVNAAPEMGFMVLIIFAVHLIILFAVGALLKLNYAELIIASLACVTGPPVAAAIAILMKWDNLVIPGILTGILGYVVGNFIGIGIFIVLGGALQ